MDDKMKDNDKFDYDYSAPNSEERRFIESIRREYLPQEEHDEKLAEIKSLHKKATMLPKALALTIGVVGTLVLGVGMTMTLVWDKLVGGIIVGLIGMAIMFLAYPIFQFLQGRCKKKYGSKIVSLADELSDGAYRNEKENRAPSDEK